MKTIYLAAVLLLAGTVSCTPAHKIIDLPEWIPDINLPEIIGSIREVISQILELIGIEINLPDISLVQLLERLLEALGIEKPEIDWENITLEQILEILGINLDDIDLENITLEDILEIIITRIQEIIADIDLPEININRPIEGTAVPITNLPSIAQIETGVGPVWVQTCVGAIITNFHVLSSARCFSGKLYDPSRLRARVGSSSRYTDGTISEVDFAINNDEISIVRLVSSLPFTDAIQTTSIIAQDFVTPVGSVVSTAGWGKTSQGRILFSDRDLNQIDLTVIDRDACAEQWSRIPISSVQVTSNHICVGRSETGGRDADIRDTGAPLMFNNILIGVQSYGKFIGNQNYPVVYASIAPYTDWIVQNAN